MLTAKKQVKYFGRDLEAMSFANNYYSWIIDEFKPYLGDCAAEVGAGTGNFSRLLLNSNIKTLTAFEPSDNMYPLLESNMDSFKKVRTIHGYFGEKHQYFEDYFESILYINVLEHIKEDRKELSYAYSSLKKNGYVCIFVPALSFLYSKFDKRLGHFRRYHIKDLVSIVEYSGFEVVKIKYFDFLGIIPWYMNFVLLKRDLSVRNVSTYDKRVVPVIRIIESIFSPPIGKNLLLIGKKVM